MARTAPKGWDNLATSSRLFCFPQLTTDVSHDPGDARTGSRPHAAGGALDSSPNSRRGGLAGAA
jgi:hypothetical protein